MNKKVFVVVLLMFGLAGSALALAPMGPPTAGLKTGQFRVGVEYSYSDEDMEVESETIDNVTSNMIFGNLGYGIMDEWEVFVRLGMANVEADDVWGSGVDVSGDFQFAWGFGTKVTFLKQEDLNWGALFQMTWLKSEDDPLLWGTDVEFDFYDMQIAVGPTWKLNDTFSVYGGPFVHLIEGDVDLSNDEDESVTGDLNEDSAFGGYIGTEAALSQNTSWYGEFQITGGGWGLATGINWKF
jgi:hypothetical protein